MAHRGRVGSPGRLTPLRWCLLAVSVFALAGCAASPVTDTTPTPSAPVVIELDGQLHAVPVAHQRPPVSSGATLEVLSLQYYLRASSYQQPVLARVTWTAASNTFRPIGPVPIRQGAVAWVLVFREISEDSCFFPPSAAPAPSGEVSDADAVIVDATSGAAAIYLGRHPRCGTWTAATIDAAGRYWSLPWTTAGRDSVTVTLPPCGVLAGSTYNGNELIMVGATPLGLPCPQTTSTTLTTDIASPGPGTAHAPVGVLCAHHEPDVDLPAIPDCLNLP